MSVERVTDVIAGGEALPVSDTEKIGSAAAALDRLSNELKEARIAGESDRVEQLGKARGEAATELQAMKVKVDEQNAKTESERDAAIDQLIADAKSTREPSKAWMLAGGQTETNDYQAGDFLYNLMVRGDKDSTIGERQAAETRLAEMGAVRHDAPGVSLGTGRYAAKGGYIPPAKATLGTASTTGGILIPGATVSDLIKPPRAATAVSGLVRTLNVNSYQTSIPVRVAAPTRAAVVAWGITKDNVNLTYGGYTATAYTLAIIYDVAKQLLRYSGGAVEADLRGELETSFELGKAYYILQGAGTTEPYGIQTAIATAFSAYTSSFSPVSTTLAGSVAKAIATAAGGLQVRNWQPEAALLGVAAYWDMVSQGTDTAGFFFAPSAGPTAIRPGTLLSPWGIPVYAETQLAGTDDLLVGAFSAVQVFQGETFRVDTSEEAGDRWDKNLVGFRGENEIGLDARPAVFAGAFQFIADVVP